jgi:glutamate-5-semialdehyde dehydrogenase
MMKEDIEESLSDWLRLLDDPIGEVLGMKKRPNGLMIGQKRVPLGVVGIIYEARPNVTADAFALCFKTGNVVILKGGSDAIHSNIAIVETIRKALVKEGLPEQVIALIEDTSRETAAAFMKMNEYVDVLIPRGGAGLIKAVVNQATIPVIETGAGICHTYFDEFGDVSKGADIIYNAKTRRVSVCNALDCTIVHEKRLDKLPLLCEKLKDSNVIIYADPRAYQALDGHYPAELLQPATKESFGTEFLDYKMAVKTVKSFEDALRHIQENSSRHSECIVTENSAPKLRLETRIPVFPISL